MGKEPFLTTTNDEPGEGPDLPGVEQGDRRNALARLLGERGRTSLPPASTVPRTSLSRLRLPRPALPKSALPGWRRGGRPDQAPVDALVDAPVDAPVDDAPVEDAPAVVSIEDVPADVDPELELSLEDALVEALADEEMQDASDEERADALQEVVLEWAWRVIAAYPRPSFPLEREWDASVQGIVRSIPYLPRLASAPLALLDRFGAVTIGPERVGLDGKDVDWDRVLEVRTAPAWTLLSAEMLEANLAQYVVALPPVPGRGWALRKISELLITLYLAVVPPDEGVSDIADLTAQNLEDGGGADVPGVFDRVVTHVVYERRFGQGEAEASTVSALLQLAFPGTVDAMVRTAAAKDVPVVHVPAQDTSVGSVLRRAGSWRRSTLDLRDRVNRRVGR